MTLPQVNSPGYACKVTIDAQRRQLVSGDARIGYPFQLPAYGENIAWGKWSHEKAAVGMVCWWVLDPNLPGRGHRRILLEPDFRYCGIGIARAPVIGLVATFDATSAPLVAHHQTR